MVIPHLIRYILVIATRQSTVRVSLSALAAVFLLSACLLSITAAVDYVPPAEIQCAKSDDGECGQYAEQEPEKEQMESLSRVQGQGGLSAVIGDTTHSALAKQFQVHPTQIAEWKQQQVERSADVFGGVAP